MHDAGADEFETEAGDEQAGDRGQDGPVTELPRARPAEDELPAAVSPFGEVPRLATYWGIQRVGLGGAWDVLSYGAPGAVIEPREWPLNELSVEAVQARWGAGTYRVQWLAPSNRGGRKHLTYGRPVTVRVPVAPPPPPVAAPEAMTSGLGPEIDRMLQMQRMIASEATSKMESVLQFAALLAGGKQSGGLGAAELQLILQNQASQTEKLLAAHAATQAAALSEVRGELRDLRAARESEDASPSVGAAARAAGGFVKGGGTLATILNWASANEGIAETVLKEGLPVIASTVGRIADIVGAGGRAAPLPRAVRDESAVVPVAVVPIAPVPPKPPTVELGSLSAWGPSPAANGGAAA